jgi:hypothetical protein
MLKLFWLMVIAVFIRAGAHCLRRMDCDRSHYYLAVPLPEYSLTKKASTHVIMFVPRLPKYQTLFQPLFTVKILTVILVHILNYWHP